MLKRPPLPPSSPPPEKRQAQDGSHDEEATGCASTNGSATADVVSASKLSASGKMRLETDVSAGTVRLSSATPVGETLRRDVGDGEVRPLVSVADNLALEDPGKTPAAAPVLAVEDAIEFGRGPDNTVAPGSSSTLRKYEQFRVSVLVSALNVPKLTVRPFIQDAVEVDEFRRCFKDGLYGEGDRLISVILTQECTASQKEVVGRLKSFYNDIRDKESSGKNEMISFPRFSELAGVDLLVADGLHRLEALRTYRGAETNVDPLWCDAFFFVRRDGAKMTIADCHTIGSRLNRMDRAGREPTPYDHVHSCLSTLQQARGMSSKEVEESVLDADERKHLIAVRTKPNPSNLRSLVSKRGILGVSAWRCIWRYCQIALGLHQFTGDEQIAIMVRDAMQKGDISDNRGVTLKTIERPELWSSSSVQRFRFLFSSYLRVRRDCKLKEKHGPKLVSCLSKLWDMGVKFCNKKGLESEQGLNVSIRVPALGRGSSSAPRFVTVIQRLHFWVGQIVKQHITNGKEWETRLNHHRASLASSWPSASVLEKQGFVVSVKASAVGEKETELSSMAYLSASGEISSRPTLRVCAEIDEINRGEIAVSTGNGALSDSPVVPTDFTSPVNDSLPNTSTVPVKDTVEMEGEKTTITESESRLDNWIDEIIADCNSSGLMPVADNEGAQSTGLQGAASSPLQIAAANGEKAGNADTTATETDRGASEAMQSEAGGSAPVVHCPIPLRIPIRARSEDDIGERSNAAASAKSAMTVEQSGVSLKPKNTSIGNSRPDKIGSPYRLRDRSTLTRGQRISGAAEGHVAGNNRTGNRSAASSKRDSSTGSGRRPPSGKAKPTGTIRMKRSTGVRNRSPVADKDGFRVLRRFSNGFQYKRPVLRDGGYRKVEYKRAEKDGDCGGYVATLLDGTEINAYPDMYETKVRINKFWQLEELPGPESPIWLEKYKVPDCVDSLLKFKGAGDKEAYLRSLGFRPPHQSHFRLSMEEISQVRFSVFEYLALDLDMGGDPLSWQRSMDNHLEQKREMLDEKGFIVFRGFVKRDMEGDESDFERDEYQWKDMFGYVEQLFDFYAKDVPKTEAEYTVDKQKCWARIRNEDQLPVGVPVSDSRWTSMPYSTNARLVEVNENLLKARCYVEIATWILAHWLHLEAGFFDEIPLDYPSESRNSGLPPMFATDSGSRVLVTSQDCSAQRPHMDYIHPLFVQDGDYPETITFPGYFCISTGPETCVLYVLHGSHKLIFCSEEDKKKMSEVIGLTPIVIPSWSTIIARGDFIHAGVEGDGKNGKGCVRLHDYLLRKGIPFADQINDEGIWKLHREVTENKKRRANEVRQKNRRGIAPAVDEGVPEGRDATPEAMEEESESSAPHDDEEEYEGDAQETGVRQPSLLEKNADKSDK